MLADCFDTRFVPFANNLSAIRTTDHISEDPGRWTIPVIPSAWPAAWNRLLMGLMLLIIYWCDCDIQDFPPSPCCRPQRSVSRYAWTCTPRWTKQQTSLGVQSFYSQQQLDISNLSSVLHLLVSRTLFCRTLSLFHSHKHAVSKHSGIVCLTQLEKT